MSDSAKWEVFPDESTFEDEPAEETPTAASQEPLVEDTPEPDDAETILAKYGNDPKKLAAAYRELEKAYGKQGNEVGQLRTNPYSGATGTTPEAEQQTPVQELPPPIKVLSDDEVYREGVDEIDPRTGWFLGEDGKPVRPDDKYGVPYTPESRWRVRKQELLDEYKDDPITAYEKYQQEMQAEAEQRKQAYIGIYQKVEPYHQTYAQQKQQGIITELVDDGLTQEETVAIVNALTEHANNAVRIAYERKIIGDEHLLNPYLYSQAIEAAYTDALRNRVLHKWLEQLRAQNPAPAQTPAPAGATRPTPTATAPRVPATERRTATGMFSQPAPQANDEEFVNVRGLKMSKKEYDDLSAKDYEFD